MSLHVVATAGHVDHGKSSLVRALTGTDPDRFEEEKRRGLTIDLGFAWCTLPSGRELGFVDVPGHERFIRNMLAGVGPVRLVLFIVAADEGWKPQSEEHLAILDLLGVDGAVVALTKSDLVDDETLDRARVDLARHLASSALADAPIVACSAPTGAGIDDLVGALDAMLAAAPSTSVLPPRPRQFLDRIFTIKGAGTVVTGTLAGGDLAVGDEVEILPQRMRARVRGLRSHDRVLERAEPTARVAVNLAGVDRADLARGDALGLPGQWLISDVFDARIRPVRGLDALPTRGSFKVYLGSAERDAKVRFYGDSGFARIRLAEPIALDAFDRFVLRETGRGSTVGGGTVLDPMPPLRPGPDAGERLAAREAAGRAGLPSLLVAERGALLSADLLPLTGSQPDTIDGAQRSQGWWLAETLVDDLATVVRSDLQGFHATDPFLAGADLARIRSLIADRLTRRRMLPDPSLTDAVLACLSAAGQIVNEGSVVRLPEHAPDTGGEDLRRLLDAAAGPTPPGLAELAATGFSRDLIQSAIAAGALVRIAPDLVVTADAVAQAEAELRAMAQAGEPITVSAFRERVGTSRKYAVPLLEHFDRRGLTRREGDRRILRAGPD